MANSATNTTGLLKSKAPTRARPQSCASSDERIAPCHPHVTSTGLMRKTLAKTSSACRAQLGFSAAARELEAWLVGCHERLAGQARRAPSRADAAWRREYDCIEEVRWSLHNASGLFPAHCRMSWILVRPL